MNLKLIVFFLFVAPIAKAQIIYATYLKHDSVYTYMHIDMASGRITEKFEINGANVGSATFSQNLNTYFLSADSMGFSSLYAIDENTDSKLRKIITSRDYGFYELQYSSKKDSLYAIIEEKKSKLFYLGIIDYKTGNFRKINELPALEWISFGSSTLDKRNNRYTFMGGQDLNTNITKIYIVGLESNKIVHLADFGVSGLTEMYYDSVSNKLMGLYPDAPKLALMNIDTVTGQSKDLQFIEGVNDAQVIYKGSTMYDEKNKRVAFANLPASGDSKIEVVIASTQDAKVVKTLKLDIKVYRHPITNLQSKNLETALATTPEVKNTSQISLYEPSKNLLIIKTPDNSLKAINIFDMNGKAVLNNVSINKAYSNIETLEIANLKNGVYTILISLQDGTQVNKKWVKM